jgi:hypothetical protein
MEASALSTKMKSDSLSAIMGPIVSRLTSPNCKPYIYGLRNFNTLDLGYKGGRPWFFAIGFFKVLI